MGFPTPFRLKKKGTDYQVPGGWMVGQGAFDNFLNMREQESGENRAIVISGKPL